VGLEKEDLVSLMRRHPLITFFVLAYVLSWWPWILYAIDLSPQPIVGFGPFLAAIVVLAISRGKTGVVGLLRRMVRWRVGLRWYAVAIVVVVVYGPQHLSRKHRKQEEPVQPEVSTASPRVV
jgi:uncharacterized protein